MKGGRNCWSSVVLQSEATETSETLPSAGRSEGDGFHVTVPSAATGSSTTALLPPMFVDMRPRRLVWISDSGTSEEVAGRELSGCAMLGTCGTGAGAEPGAAPGAALEKLL